MITEEEALRQGLPGSDSFLRTQLAYKNDQNRDALIRYLNREAYKAFMDTVTIGQYPSLHAAQDSGITDHISNPLFWQLIEYIDLENFKIAAGFELHLKACLLANNVVIHRINKTTPAFKALRTKQQDQPVYRQELLAIEGFYYDGTRNILRGLTPHSLNFDEILEKLPYRQQLGKPPALLSLIEDFHRLRNQIHMPGDPVETTHLQTYAGDSLMRAFVNFINDDIVAYNDKLIDKWGSNRAQKVPRLNYFD